jgi:hypothetical protein
LPFTLIIAEARYKYVILSIVWCIIGASNTVEYVFAEVRSIRTSRITNFDAELIAAHETWKAASAQKK